MLLFAYQSKTVLSISFVSLIEKYNPYYYFEDGVLEVTCIAFHHEVKEILLVGYGNGELRLYHTQKQSSKIPVFHSSELCFNLRFSKEIQ